MKAGLLLVSLLAVGLPSAALGLEMSGALGRLSVNFLPTPVRASLTAPGLGRFACAAAGFQLLHPACLMAQRALLLHNTHTHTATICTKQSCTQQSVFQRRFLSILSHSIEHLGTSPQTHDNAVTHERRPDALWADASTNHNLGMHLQS